MKRIDQILQVLAAQEAAPIPAARVAGILDTAVANISGPLNELVDAGLAEKTGDRPQLYGITDAGREHMRSPEFGADRRAAVTSRPASPPPAAVPMSIGVFTSGELHIEANGKRVILSQAQARELVDFICSLPNKLFASAESTSRPRATPFAALGVGNATVHRIADSDD